MDHFKIDKETSKLILGVFNKINLLKKALYENHHQSKELLESGQVLNNMMNKALESPSQTLLESKFGLMIEHVKQLRTYSDTQHNLQNSQNLTQLFNLLLVDLTSLQYKIEAEL